jgi:hypothetical protein
MQALRGYCSKVPGGDLATAPVGGRPWCHPWDAGFAFVQNEKVMRSWEFPQRFQRQTSEARQCVGRSEPLQKAPERVMHKAVSEAKDAMETP